ncbi:MAG: DUF11 domain-containing protein [Chloroflexota bacterium]|nr:DUF11 domain-containing protein [Chloroflexota bacterium]
MTTRSTYSRIRTFPILAAFFLNLFVGPVTPFLTAPVAALGSSTFNAIDGNLTDDGSSETDWCTPAPNFARGDDSPSGSSDTSFSSSNNKEDSDIPTLALGTIPGNKDDLVREYVASETVAGDLFVYLAWVRADSTGTSTIDFEFNQSDVVSSNGKTKVRTSGDLLVTFDFQANPGSQGGYSVNLELRTWDANAADTPDPTSSPANKGAWVNPVDLDASGLAEGSVNGSDITDCKNGNSALATGTFGEAVLDLTAILGGDCKAFGSIFTKSRSSNSFSADLKDRIDPLPVDLSTCSDITILKVDQFQNPVGGATFTITPHPFNANHTGSLDVLDNTGQQGYSGADDDATPGTIHLSDVEPYSANGGYEICEKSAPSADYVPDATCITQAVGANSSVTFGPFVNELLYPELRIEKTPDEDQADASANDVTAGDYASFSITLYNDGTGTAKGATLSDDLPAMTNGWAVQTKNWAGACVITGSAGGAQHLACGPEDIGAGGSRTVTVRALSEAPDDCGDVNNPDATGDATNADPVNDSGNVDVLCGDLDVEKSPDEDAQKPTANDIYAGDDAIFSIVTTNKGDGEARGSTLEDDLPAVDNGWAIIANPGSEDAWADCEITGSAGGAQHLSCGPEDIEAGGSRTVTLSATTTLADCGTLSNPAADVDSTNDGNDSDSGEIDVLCPDVSVEKTTDTPEINASDEARYTITVSASGIGTSEDVTLYDELPPVDGTWSQYNAACKIEGNILECSFGDMEPGDEEVIHLSHTTTPEDCGTLSNDVSISSLKDLDDSDNAVRDVEITVNCPDIAVEKTGSGTVNATDSIYFEITVSNNGDGDAYDFSFNDTLPDVTGGWTLPTQNNSPASCELNGVALSCSVEDGIFLAGDSFTVRVEADTAPADCGDLDNTAYASASNEGDDALGNNSDGHEIVVECPDLTASKDADDTIVSAGQEIGFTISVSNSDADGTGTAYSVEFNDLLPAGSGLDWSIDPDNEDCEITGSVGSQVLECNFGDLGPDESASVHVVSDTTKADCATYPNVADITSTNHPELNPSDSVTVECPGLNIAKVADKSPIDAGETASFSIVVWNTGPGTAFNVTIDDDLPGDLAWSEDSDACEIVDGALECWWEELGVTSMQDSPARVTLSAETDRSDCGDLDNKAFANASNADEVFAEATIYVACPTVAIEKVNNQSEPVLPGTTVSFTLTVSVSDGPASDVVVVDTLPAGYDDPSSISDSGVWDGGARTITWELGSLEDGDYELTYQAAVSADAEQGDELVNVAVVTSPNSQCPDDENLADECDDDSTVLVRVPTLVIDKEADAEVVHFVFDVDGSVLSVDPEQVTWTLTYTLTNGPVYNAVITDPLPDFLTFVSASDGGVYADGVITWELGRLTESGSVSFVTTVDSDAPEVNPIENVATIVSDETAPDDGVDSIRITSEQVEAGTSTPSASVPDSAISFTPAGQPITIPVELMAALFLLSLGGLAFANVKAARRRR